MLDLSAITEEAKIAFLYEDAPDYLHLLEQGIIQLKNAYNNPQVKADLDPTYKNLLRAVHSLKGGAGIAQLMTLNQLAHKMEDILSALEQDQVKDKQTALELIILATENVQDLIAGSKAGKTEPETLDVSLILDEFIDKFVANTAVYVDHKVTYSDFITVALTVDLDSCLQRLEKELKSPKSPKHLYQALKILLEECKLLGQALSFQWLVEIFDRVTAYKQWNRQNLIPLIKFIIQEIRTLRDTYLQDKNHTTEISLSPKFNDQFPLLTPILKEGDLPSPPITDVPPSTPQKESDPLQTLQLRLPVDRIVQMTNTVGELMINYEQLTLYETQIKQASFTLKRRSQSLFPLREKIKDFYDQMTVDVSQYNLDDSPFDSLQFDKYNTLHSTVQQLQEVMVQVQEVQEDIELVRREFQDSLLEIKNSLETLNGALTQSRLIPFGKIAQRFIQPIANLNQRFNKQVQLVIRGENILIDQVILEQLQTPLNHLVRNAFDHGIESEPERLKLNKDTPAIISLSANLKGGQILITIADNGRGIDLDKLYQTARKKGLIPTTISRERMTDQEILNLIFHAGFSTKDEVTSLSGRGVGLDVVKLQIQQLKGNIKVQTEKNKGTVFSIRVPLTLNILPLVLVRCQQQLFALPSTSIREMIALGDFQQDNQQILWGSERLDWVNLLEILPYAHPSFKVSRSTKIPEVGLVIESENKRFILGVNQVVTEKELVIKPFDETVTLPDYISGCTILGTGEVIPVIIPDALEGLFKQKSKTVISDLEKITNSSDDGQPTILVVDDSIAVRRTVTQVLNQVNYRVIQCPNGKEAWKVLTKEKQPIRLIISDLEMPELDGFSLLQLIRSNRQFQNLPFLLLTSRDSEVHRQKAQDLGANSYFTKPFNPILLVQEINHLLTKRA